MSLQTHQDPDEIERDLEFPDIGLDSMQIVNMAAAIDEKFGVDVPIGAILDNPTINGLAQYIASNID